MCKKEFSVTWGCESAIKKPSGGGKQEVKVMLCQSTKRLSSLFFCNVPTTVSSFPFAPASNVASKSTTASCDVIITSVPGVVASTPTPSATADSPAPNQMMIDQLMTLQTLVTTAECRMILRIVKNHDSFRSCLGLGTDLKALSPDSRIAANFTLSKTKCAYAVNYSIAPLLKENLQKVISESPINIVFYNESLNRQMQEQQIDLQVQYWCNKTN